MKQTIFYILFVILLLTLISVIILYEIENSKEEREKDIQNKTLISYNEGFNQGQLFIIQEINTNGNIPVLTEESNQTRLDWITIERICGIE